MIAFAVGWLVGSVLAGLVLRRWSRVRTLVAVTPLGLALLLVFWPRATVYDGCQTVTSDSIWYWLWGCFLP